MTSKFDVYNVLQITICIKFLNYQLIIHFTQYFHSKSKCPICNDGIDQLIHGSDCLSIEGYILVWTKVGPR